LGSLLVLFLRAAEAQGTEREAIFATLRRAAIVPALCAVSLLAVILGIRLAPHTWDYGLYNFDRLLGIDTFRVGRWLLSSAAVSNICAVIYDVLPLYISATLMIMCPRGRWRTTARMAVTLGVAGFLAYQICPAAGPLYAFPKLFPWKLPPAGSLPEGPAAAPDGLRNAMPSLHVAFALLCYWNLAPLGRGLRLGAIAYLLFTALATIGFGEHYFIDLVVAVPLAVAVYGAWVDDAQRHRWLLVAAAIGMVLSWLVALRTGAIVRSPEFAWTAVLATVIGSLALKRGLGSQSEAVAARPLSLRACSSGKAVS
jgi:hypothetical protein